MSTILHITRRADWEAALSGGLYRGDTLDSQGFIHCSTPEQAVRVANALFRGQTGLVLLVIDSEKVQAKVKFEPPIHPTTGETESGGELFPHIYGPLNPDAVVKVMDFPPDDAGWFTLPTGIA